MAGEMQFCTWRCASVSRRALLQCKWSPATESMQALRTMRRQPDTAHVKHKALGKPCGGADTQADQYSRSSHYKCEHAQVT